MENEYSFDENTPPKEIVASAMTAIAEIMKNDGFKFSKSKLEIKKKTEEFIFQIYSQSNRYNAKGDNVRIYIHAFVSDNKGDVYFWGKLLSTSNAKQDVKQWELYGKENYEQSLQKIKEIILSNLLPFFRRFEYDLQNFTNEVAEKGFCPFGDTQVYDADYKIPIDFLLKYGTKEQMNMAFQYYIDRHELWFVKPNIEKAIALLKEGKEVVRNGEKDYAEFAVKHGVELIF